jgi:plasmid rolling circle replication initiator protein Rep
MSSIDQSTVELNSVLSKYDKKKSIADDLNLSERISKISYSQDDIYQRKAERVKNCASFLAFDKYQSTKKADDIMRSLRTANFCKDKFCPMCNWRQSQRLMSDMMSIFDQLDKDRYELIFMTLTMSNPPMNQIRNALVHMAVSFNRLMKYKAVQAVVKGFLRSVEFIGDKTADGYCHPHYHCLIVVNKSYFTDRTYLSQKKWRELWKRALRVDYLPEVNVKKIKARKFVDELGVTHQFSAIQSAVCEVTKYCLKSSALKAMSDKDFKDLYIGTRSIRKYRLGGILREIKPLEQEIDEELWRYLGLEIYRWSKEKRIYVEQELDFNDPQQKIFLFDTSKTKK